MCKQKFLLRLKRLRRQLFCSQFLLLAFLTGCQEKDPNRVRDDFIAVYTSLDDLHNEDVVPVESFFVPSTGGFTTVYVKSNVDFSVQWQNSSAEPWGKVVSCDKIEEQVFAIKLKTLPRSKTSAYYTKRTATLMLSAEDIDFGAYLTVYQGLIARQGSDFSWLQYGTDNPLAMDGTLMDDWKEVDTDQGYLSTPIDGESHAYVFGKNGYLQLGDDMGHGADIITPFSAGDIRNDSLLVLTLRAVAFADADGIKDNNKMTVEVLGGGVIRDFADEGTTKIEFELPYYDVTSVENDASSMWKDSELLIGIASTKKNPITADTRIRITAGELGPGDNNRIFIDNVYLRRIYCQYGKPIEEDLYTLNGGSGADKILGLRDSFPDDVWTLN